MDSNAPQLEIVKNALGYIISGRPLTKHVYESFEETSGPFWLDFEFLQVVHKSLTEYRTLKRLLDVGKTSQNIYGKFQPRKTLNTHQPLEVVCNAIDPKTEAALFLGTRDDGTRSKSEDRFLKRKRTECIEETPTEKRRKIVTSTDSPQCSSAFVADISTDSPFGELEFTFTFLRNQTIRLMEIGCIDKFSSVVRATHSEHKTCVLVLNVESKLQYENAMQVLDHGILSFVYGNTSPEETRSVWTFVRIYGSGEVFLDFRSANVNYWAQPKKLRELTSNYLQETFQFKRVLTSEQLVSWNNCFDDLEQDEKTCAERKYNVLLRKEIKFIVSKQNFKILTDLILGRFSGSFLENTDYVRTLVKRTQEIASALNVSTKRRCIEICEWRFSKRDLKTQPCQPTTTIGTCQPKLKTVDFVGAFVMSFDYAEIQNFASKKYCRNSCTKNYLESSLGDILQKNSLQTPSTAFVFYKPFKSAADLQKNTFQTRISQNCDFIGDFEI